MDVSELLPFDGVHVDGCGGCLVAHLCLSLWGGCRGRWCMFGGIPSGIGEALQALDDPGELVQM